MQNVTKIYVGVDVSKRHLDIHFHHENISFRISNDENGINNLLKQLMQYAVEQVVFESSGGYENLLMRMLKQAGYRVWQVDPKRIKGFITAQGIKAKTDKLDAKMIALFASKTECQYTQQVASEAEKKLRELVLLRNSLVEAIASEKKRLKQTEDACCIQHREKYIAQTEALVAAVTKEIIDLIDNDDDLNKKAEILCSMKGIGKTTAGALLAGLPELGAIENKQLAALIGVAPFTRESGIYRGEATIKDGRAAPRKALYMAALTAAHTNSPFGDFYKRLIAAGKKPKVALVAVMRKMIVILNVMIKNMQPWNPQYT